MIATDELRGVIAKKGFSQSQLAKKLGMTSNTFYRKMHKGVFDSDEICQIIEILNIEEPMGIFFTKSGT